MSRVRIPFPSFKRADMMKLVYVAVLETVGKYPVWVQVPLSVFTLLRVGYLNLIFTRYFLLSSVKKKGRKKNRLRKEKFIKTQVS